MFIQVWLLNCGQVQTMLGQFTVWDDVFKCIKENEEYLSLDLEISLTQSYRPYPTHC